jgi:D-amino-acid oxidase
MTDQIGRRRLLQSAAALTLSGCATLPRGYAAYRPTLAPIRASADRLFDVTVCLRPFRAAGPRLESERIGDKLVVHNYGHGGSGWSLSWGSADVAVRQAMAASPSEIAVIGCGAIGLTSAITAQRAGAKVTIYARDLLPATRSARATGSWTPDSRIALANVAAPGFADQWEAMARLSFKTYRQYLGLPGTPVEWVDQYFLHEAHEAEAPEPPGALDFASYHRRIADLTPKAQLLPAGSTPFPVPEVRRTTGLMFNLADYGHTLISDFRAAGGTIVHAEFHAPADLAALPEPVIINCPGVAAREWWKDASITPVRGQIAWLVPQPEVTYGVYYRGVNTLPRRDGVLLQDISGGDMKGYGDTNETPDRADAEHSVSVIAELFSRFRG